MPDSMPAPRVVAIVTARDEEERISSTVRGLLEVAQIRSVTVVDDGSADRTVEEARAAEGAVLRMPATGKGTSLENALDRVARAEVYVLADGDLGSSAAGIRPLIEPVLGGRADLAVGIRREGSGW